MTTIPWTSESFKPFLKEVNVRDSQKMDTIIPCICARCGNAFNYDDRSFWMIRKQGPMIDIVHAVCSCGAYAACETSLN